MMNIPTRFRTLEKFLDGLRDWPKGQRLSSVQIAHNDYYMLVRVPHGHVFLHSSLRVATITGTIADRYNVYAYAALDLYAIMYPRRRLLAYYFQKWLYEADKDQQKQKNEKRLHDLAARCGHKLVKQ